MMDRETILRMACEAGLRNSNPGAAQEILRFAAMLTAPTWMPIESAPKFSDEIDIWSDGRRFTDCAFGKPTYGKEHGWLYESRRDSDGPVYELVRNPTHWMPLPKSP